MHYYYSLATFNQSPPSTAKKNLFGSYVIGVFVFESKVTLKFLIVAINPTFVCIKPNLAPKNIIYNKQVFSLN